MPGHPLALSGERTLPGIAHEQYWFARHVAAYRCAAPRCRGATILDAGCGEGYGSALLAEEAEAVIGVDRASDVIAHAAATYPQARFEVADLRALPSPDAAVDVVVSLQVIEHLPDVPAALAETARVLRPGGLLLCATPNRLTFTPDSRAPRNPFHFTEFTAGELRDALAGSFEATSVLGVRHGPRLTAIEAEAGRSLPELQLSAPAEQWPPWLSEVVASVEPDDFVVAETCVDTSLDLLAVATSR